MNAQSTGKKGQRSRQEGAVVTWGCKGEQAHADQFHIELAKRVASFLRLEYGGRLEDFHGRASLYLVPLNTLCGDECAKYFKTRNLTELNFLGGWVAKPVLATKAIAHPLAPGEVPPPGWSSDFAAQAAGLVLNGYTAFTRTGALESGQRLLEKGDIRLKPIGASGGTGQQVVTGHVQLRQTLDEFDFNGPSPTGLVLEENLTDVETYSVGRLTLGATNIAYIGTQELTLNDSHEEIYGGSRLSVVRGGFEDLLTSSPPDLQGIGRLGAEFDRLADVHLGLLASRRNYDVVSGIDGAGHRRQAVLEQSWRVGGASSAEIAAAIVLRDDPSLHRVRVASVERYDPGTDLPERADVHYRGNDPAAGPVLKYSIVESDP